MQAKEDIRIRPHTGYRVWWRYCNTGLLEMRGV